jgi:hypothetical protein
MLTHFETDKEAEVRRGCVYVFNLLLKGLGKDLLQLIPDAMTSLYRNLKAVENSDPDDICKYPQVIC